MRADAKCRSCGADIRWVVTEATGKQMPLDPEPNPDGNVWIVRYEDGHPVVAVATTPRAVPSGEVYRFRSHFATCVQADSWRKRR